MQIIITKTDKEELLVEFNNGVSEETLTFSTAIAMFFGGLEGVVQKALKEFKGSKEAKALFEEKTYDSLDTFFSILLANLFPNIDPHKFDLTSAAIVKAQDEIIEEAYSKGKTYDEALKAYEEKALEYIKKRKAQ